MRSCLAAIALAMFAAAPASAQPSETAQVERQLTEGGRWAEQYGQALLAASNSAGQLSKNFQALAGAPLTPEKAAAAMPGLRRDIELSRADVRLSNAMLDALPALTADVAAEINPEQLLADGRAHNKRMLALLDNFDVFVVAMGKNDRPAMERALPGILEGSFTALGQQRLLLRNRQATVPRSDSQYQVLGVAAQLYRAMEAMFRSSIPARMGHQAEAIKAAAALHVELRSVADETRELAAVGRRNLERELAEIEALRKSGTAAEAAAADRVRLVLAAEAKTFALADRLVAFAEANKAVTPAQLKPVGSEAATAPLRQMERDYAEISLEQAALLAGER